MTAAADYLARVTAALAAESEPARQAALLTVELKDLPNVVQALSRQRHDVITGMKANGATVQEIADAMNMSRARAYELLRVEQPR